MADTLGPFTIRFRKAPPKASACPICQCIMAPGAQAALDASTKYLEARDWPNWWVRLEDEESEDE